MRTVKDGVNMEMTSANYRQSLLTTVKNGTVSEAQIDAMVRPILEMKYRLGLFNNPYVDIDRFHRETLSAEQRTAVEKAAEETAVLLKNEGHPLPLSRNVKSIAVIGPLADSKLDIMGSWAIHGDRNDAVTVAQGIREALPSARVDVSTGVEIARGSATIFDEQVIPVAPVLLTAEARKTEFDHAVGLAHNADVVLMVLGEAQTMNGENAPRASTDDRQAAGYRFRDGPRTIEPGTFDLWAGSDSNAPLDTTFEVLK